MTRACRGQTILEYTMIVGIVTTVLFYMGPGLKRGVQSVIKITADQLGNQANSEQDFSDATEGYMVSSNSVSNEVHNKQVQSRNYVTNSVSQDAWSTQSDVLTNAGFNPSSN